MRDFNQAWVDEDVDRIVADVTDDIHFGMAGEAAIVGKAGFREFLEQMPGGQTNMQLDIEQVLIDGERAAVCGDISMTHEDGKRRRYAFCDIYKLRDGKVARLTAHVNEYKAASSVG